MPKRDPRLHLKNIQEDYPITSILFNTLRVDTNTLKMIHHEESNNGDDMCRLKQTARKSTYSKLKPDETCSLNSTPDHSKKPSMLSNPAEVKHKTPSFTTSSTLLPDNKLVIFTKKNGPVQCKANDSDINSEISEENKNLTAPHQKNEKLKVTSSSTASTVGEAKENLLTNCIVDKPPIKLIVSTVNGNTSVQTSIGVGIPEEKSNTSTVSDLAENEAKVQIKTELTSNDKVCSDKPKVFPLKIIQNGKQDMKTVPSSKKIASKLSIEKVVQNLNLKQSKPTDSVSSKKPDLKRTSSTNLSDESTTNKKPKCETKDTECISNHSSLNQVHDLMDNKQTLDLKKIKTNSCESQKCFEFNDIKPEWDKLIRQLVDKEKVDLQLKLSKKNEDYNRMKEKCEGVERNFQSWIEFANKLQARIKKIAYALHKQQEIVKILETKSEIERTSVATQTDPMQQPQDMTKVKSSSVAQKPVNEVTNDCKQPNTKNNPPLLRPKPTLIAPKPNLNLSQMTPNHSSVSKKVVPNDFIDLTDDSELEPKRTISQPMNSSQKKQSMDEKLARILQPSVGHRSAAVPPSGGGGATTFVTNSNSYKNSLVTPVKKTPPTHLVQTAQLIQNNSNVYRTPNNKPPVRPKPTPKEHLLHTATVRKKPPPYPPLPMSTAPPCTIRLPSNARGPPPELMLGIKKNDGKSGVASNGGIVLSWSNTNPTPPHAEVVGYELFAFQDNPHSVHKNWRKIGDDCIAAMDLPMACTLTQFTSGCIYYFAVRGKDIYGRYGQFSKPCSNANL
ncbi:uncharacterized protein LOC143461178 isoform X1 [Clavelina lepadiformis]|uniref:uncharacterized protein LOC143461178 isoform X1 n=1 Tax=Clavelina lepadiformis TaxID=159417 RepID=UPI0040434D3B